MNTELEQLKYQIISSIVSLNDISSLSEVKKFLTDIYISHDKTHDKTKIAKNEVSNSVDSQILFWEIACLAAIDYQKAIEKLMRHQGLFEADNKIKVTSENVPPEVLAALNEAREKAKARRTIEMAERRLLGFTGD